jgi:hypothetical protein
MSDAPEIRELQRLLSDLPETLDWEQLWSLRSRVGELMTGANLETHSVLETVYNDLTTQLRVRAEELGKGSEFAEADKLTQLMRKTEGLRAELNAADSGLKFHDILNDPARQNELTALNSLIEGGGLPANYLTDLRDSLRANYRIAKAGQTGGPLRLRDVLLAWAERFRWKRKVQ